MALIGRNFCNFGAKPNFGDPQDPKYASYDDGMVLKIFVRRFELRNNMVMGSYLA